MLWVSSKDQNLRKRLQRFPHLDIEIVKRFDQVSNFSRLAPSRPRECICHPSTDRRPYENPAPFHP
jgi:hypothetical protein